MVDPMRSRRAHACVLGEIETVRPLALAGIRSAVVAQPGEPARYSRFVDTVIERIDPSTEPTKLVDRLLEYARSQHERPVLYYDGDWDLLFVSRYRQALGEGFRFVVAETELVEELVAKDRFQALADRLDLPVPPGRRLDLLDDQVTGELDLTFPIVLKPLTRRHVLWKPFSDAKAIRFDDRAALERALPALAAKDMSVLVQELIVGPESHIESYHVYVDVKGEIAGEFTGRKIRTYPRALGYSTALETTNDSSVAELGRELTNRLGLRGVAKLDFKRGKDGTLYLLEVNPRFSLWHHLGARAGVNLPLLVYRDLVGLPRPVARPVRSGVRWVSPLRDRHAAKAEGISFMPWLWWALGCEAVAAIALDDPLPAVGAFTSWFLDRVRNRPARRDAAPR
jgi:predicted ATP-grasp superfamily ATP-dependent carboligase